MPSHNIVRTYLTLKILQRYKESIKFKKKRTRSRPLDVYSRITKRKNIFRQETRLEVEEFNYLYNEVKDIIKIEVVGMNLVNHLLLFFIFFYEVYLLLNPS